MKVLTTCFIVAVSMIMFGCGESGPTDCECYNNYAKNLCDGSFNYDQRKDNRLTAACNEKYLHLVVVTQTDQEFLEACEDVVFGIDPDWSDCPCPPLRQ
jgi:hypothetical protein